MLGGRDIARVAGSTWRFARQHRVWWLVPLLALLALTALLLAAGQTASPFVYTLF